MRLEILDIFKKMKISNDSFLTQRFEKWSYVIKAAWNLNKNKKIIFP